MPYRGYWNFVKNGSTSCGLCKKTEGALMVQLRLLPIKKF